MRWRRFLLVGLAFGFWSAVSPAAHARMLHESARIVVYSTESEPGYRNSHPITLAADQISAALSRVRARSGETGGIIDLFPKKNREEAAGRLAMELSRIDSDQELHLVSFRRVGTLISGQRNASGARVFVENGRLNLIFGQIDRFFSEFRDPDRPIPPMGSRKRETSLKGEIIPADGVAFVDGRKDWVLLDLARAAKPVSAVVPTAQSADQAPGVPSPEAAIRANEKSMEEKLQVLKQLREKELITEQEYVERKRQILDVFCKPSQK